MRVCVRVCVCVSVLYNIVFEARMFALMDSVTEVGREWQTTKLLGIG